MPVFKAPTNSGGVTDGDKGDISVSGSGATWTIDNDVVTYAKMQNVSATSRILGRKTAGAGDPEELTLTEVLDLVGSAAQGDILYRNGSSWTRLAKGTASQELRMNSGATAPEWFTPSSSVDESPRALNPVSWMGAASLANGTSFATNTSYFLYLGRAGKALSTVNVVTRVTTAASSITWAEVGIFKGTLVANGAATNLTRLGFTNVAATYNSTGIKNTSVSLTGHAAEDDLWVAFGSQATAVYQLRAGLAYDIQDGGYQQFSGRISTMGASTGTNVAATVLVPWCQVIFT